MMDQFEKLKGLITKYNPEANLELISKAYEFSNEAL